MTDYTVISEQHIDDPVICVLVPIGETVEVVANRYHGELVERHVEYHLAHGFDPPLICSLTRDCGYIVTV